MQSKAGTVAEYLASLPRERREAISAVRRTILANLPDGYEEAMNWGMITYQVPLSRYPETYNGRPLMYAALASQKNHMAVYLTGVYMDDDRRAELERRFAEAGKTLRAGKSCVRFTKLEALPLEVIGDCIAEDSVADFCARFAGVMSARKARGPRKRTSSASTVGSRKTTSSASTVGSRKTTSSASAAGSRKKAPARRTSS